jgi:prefoldin subunit 4
VLSQTRFQFGECFFELTKDNADERLEAEKEKLEAEMDGIKEQLSGVQNMISDLKSKLYGRFGKNINLEE